MPVLDARALETDPDGMALLANVLRPTDPGRRRKAMPARPFAALEPPAIGREAVDDGVAEPLPEHLILAPAE